jgi:uncharacterized membrane protein (UPF0136 family)
MPEAHRRSLAVGAVLVLVAAAASLETMGRAVSLLVGTMVLSLMLWSSRATWMRSRHLMPVYIAAVVVQGAHVLEEYQTGFHRVFPAGFGAAPWSSRQFLAFNLIWLGVFVICAIAVARGKRLGYLGAIFLAIGGGIGNGLVHFGLAARFGGYFPGAYTGALALVAGSALSYQLFARVK